MFARGALQLFCCFACVVADSNVFQADFHRFEDLPSGTVGDANCNVETVETANDDQLNSILMARRTECRNDHRGVNVQ